MDAEDPEGTRHLKSISKKPQIGRTEYELLRPAGQTGTLHVLLHELKGQSNVVVTASYRSSDGHLLDQPKFLCALRLIIERHPALSVIAVDQPSSKTDGYHEIWEARLKNIDLKDCVLFLDDYDTSNTGLSLLIEQQHNEWFPIQDKTKPLWRLTVVNGLHVILTYSHFICDGKGGLDFHRSLLGALEEVEASDEYSCSQIDTSLAETSILPLPQESMDLFFGMGYKISTFRVALSFLSSLTINAILPSSAFVFFGPKFPFSAIKKPKDVKSPVVTRLQSFSFTPEIVEQAVAACRKHDTTFTSLLNTLVVVTLCTDINPKARYAHISKPIDLRRFLPAKEADGGNLRNLTWSFSYKAWLARYRLAGKAQPYLGGGGRSPPDITPNRNATNIIPVTKDKFWSAAAHDRSLILKCFSIEGKPSGYTPPTIRNHLNMSKQPNDKEVFASELLPVFRHVMWGSVSISNLGLFEACSGDFAIEEKIPSSKDKLPGWRISDSEFSFGAYTPGTGFTVYVGAVSTREGGCKINVTVNKDIISTETVEKLIKGVQGRLEWLLL